MIFKIEESVFQIEISREQTSNSKIYFKIQKISDYNYQIQNFRLEFNTFSKKHIIKNQNFMKFQMPDSSRFKSSERTSNSKFRTIVKFKSSEQTSNSTYQTLQIQKKQKIKTKVVPTQQQTIKIKT